jgi:methylamine dehydrogenase heavy chain
MTLKTLLAVWFSVRALAANAATPAPLQAEQPHTEKLGAPTPHWLLVTDVNFMGYLDGKVYLFDGDTGKMLGMLSVGTWANAVEIAPDFSALYVPELYYSRGTRGERTEVLTTYDTTELKPVGEVIIPPKRATGIPHRAYQGMTDDGRFVLIANMTPATSVSVVDVVAQKFVGEIDISGCNLIYPTGNRSFVSLCGDGTLQRIELDDTGKLAGRSHTKKFFDPDKDPITEKASRAGDTWYFFSFDGQVYPVTIERDDVKPQKPWPLFDKAESKANWKIGGDQFNAAHAPTGQLYVAVHQGGPYSHKEPGTQVWVYDVAKREAIARYPLEHPASNIAVTKDAKPLLATDSPARPAIDVYDALSGQFQRTIAGPPATPSFIQSP